MAALPADLESLSLAEMKELCQKRKINEKGRSKRQLIGCLEENAASDPVVVANSACPQATATAMTVTEENSQSAVNDTH